MPLIHVAIGRVQPYMGCCQVAHVGAETAHLKLRPIDHIIGQGRRETEQMAGSIDRNAIQRNHIPAEVAATDIDG